MGQLVIIALHIESVCTQTNSQLIQAVKVNCIRFIMHPPPIWVNLYLRYIFLDLAVMLVIRCNVSRHLECPHPLFLTHTSELRFTDFQTFNDYIPLEWVASSITFAMVTTGHRSLLGLQHIVTVVTICLLSQPSPPCCTPSPSMWNSIIFRK